MGKTNQEWKRQFDDIRDRAQRIAVSFGYSIPHNYSSIGNLIERLEAFKLEMGEGLLSAIKHNETVQAGDIKRYIVKIDELVREANRAADKYMRELTESPDWRPNEVIGEDYYSSLPDRIKDSPPIGNMGLMGNSKSLGDRRVVVLKNAEGYAITVNTTFGIVQFGSKGSALRYTLSDAVDILKRLNSYPRPGGPMWAERVEDGKAIGGFLTKNFKLPKVRKGILHSK